MLLAAAVGGARPDPLDTIPAFLGGSPVVGILADAAEANATAFVPSAPPARPDRVPQPMWFSNAERVSVGSPTPPADAGFVSVRADADPLLFALTPTAAVAGITAPATGMQPTAAPAAPVGASASGGPAVAVAAAPTASTLPTANTGEPLLRRAPAAITADTATGGTVSVGTGEVASPLGTIIGGSGLPTLTASREHIADLPPNAAPVATNNSATMAEDGGSVIIDVLADDTDADGDSLQIDRWNGEPAHGTVTQTTDGKLKYTPFPDFNGTDTFTYAATDGRDVSNAATVTVTVDAVNDAPVAFKDAFSYHNKWYGTDVNGDGKIDSIDPTITVSYLPSVTGSLLDNDIDYDGPHSELRIVDFDWSALPPGLSVDVDKETGYVTTFDGPAGFLGEVPFGYRMEDNKGAMSDWVGVTLFVYGPPADNVPGAPVTATQDTVVVGDNPQSVDVLANDSNAYVAVVATHPQHGRLSDFAGGSVTVTPGLVPLDTEFKYVVFGPTGATAALALVQVVGLKMVIHNGQNGPPIREENRNGVGCRFAIGAFTVANSNDTDGDGTVDNKDTGGVNGGTAQEPGVPEMDLMKVRIYRPTNFPVNEKDSLTVTASAGAKLFTSPTREGDGAQSITFTGGSFVVDGKQQAFTERWVEIANPSGAIRDISVTMQYGLAPYAVNATGIWSGWAFRTEGNQPAPGTNKTYQQNFLFYEDVVGANKFSLGMPPMLLNPFAPQGEVIGYVVNLVNGMEFDFTITPANVANESSRIRFDSSRSIEAKGWRQYQVDGKAGPLEPDAKYTLVFPSFRERGTDDLASVDEDNNPRDMNHLNHIYSHDLPSSRVIITPASKEAQAYNVRGTDGKIFLRMVDRHNFNEFVRVKLDGTGFEHDRSWPKAKTQAIADSYEVQGSRASELVGWRAWIDFKWDAGAKEWVRTPDVGQNKYNAIELYIEPNRPSLDSPPLS